MVDGYAVVCADGAGKVGGASSVPIFPRVLVMLCSGSQFPVVADLKAGSHGGVELHSGAVAYVTTGGPIPVGADGVVKVTLSFPWPTQPRYP
jgi:molybdopterin biosynthesis enzyme